MHRIRLAYRILALTACCGFLGCDTDDPAPAGAAPVAPVIQTGAPVTDEEARQIGERLVAAAKSGDISGVAGVFDWDATIEIAMAGTEMSPQLKQGFTAGFKSSSNAPTGIHGQLAETTSAGGSVKVLRVRERDQSKSVVVRLLMPDDAGVAYFELVLARRPSGQVLAIDVYVWTAGELMSVVLRRQALPALAHEQRSLFERLGGTENVFMQHLSTIDAIVKALQAGNPQEVLRLFGTLPKELQESKNMLLLRLRAAQLVDEPAYMAVMEDLRRLFPNDPGVDFVSMDYFALRTEYDKALECIDRVEAAVGGDPYLHVTRAAMHILKGDLAAATGEGHKAVEQEPDLLPGWYALVTVALKFQDHAETLNLLRKMRDELGVQFNDLTTLPDYAAFVASPQYQEFMSGAPAPAGTL